MAQNEAGQQAQGYMLALTGGDEEPWFTYYSTWDALANSAEYLNLRQLFNAAAGERADVLKITAEGVTEVVESHIY